MRRPSQYHALSPRQQRYNDLIARRRAAVETTFATWKRRMGLVRARYIGLAKVAGPILMTAIATVLGAVPIAFATGAGAETRNPLGLVVVGGLSIATFMTLFVIPIVYIVVDAACVKFTGKSSAHGLRKAQEIERETVGAAPEPAPAK